MKVTTAEEMRELERLADKGGLSYQEMMENAGRAAAQAIHDRLKAESAQILVLVGPGNNGGDGLVTARYLPEWGHAVSVYIWKRDMEDDPNLERATDLGVSIVRADDDKKHEQLDRLVLECDIIVDALLGIGVSGLLRGDLPELLDYVRARLFLRGESAMTRASIRRPTDACQPGEPHPLIVAIDLPSGMDADTGAIDGHALRADVTVTFAHPKRGHFLYPAASYVGELVVADIGVDPALAEDLPVRVATPEFVAELLPPRPSDAHKGTFGKCLVVAGSTQYVGAPCLASRAAYRSGAGLVTLAVPGAIHPLVAAKLTETTFLMLPHDMGVLVPDAVRLLSEQVGGYDALLLGPGLGQEDTTAEFVAALLGSREASRAMRRRIGFCLSTEETSATGLKLPPMVIDADGLNLLAKCEAWHRHIPPGSVLTPHPGEMARLLECELENVALDRFGVAGGAAARWGCTVVLKGAYTLVASPDGGAAVIPFATPALATAGTGDVLAGAIAGLMAQGLSGHDAAVCGAYLHGWAGQKLEHRLGRAGAVAGDLLPVLPEAMKATRAKRDG